MARCDHIDHINSRTHEYVKCPYQAEYLVRLVGGTIVQRCRDHKESNGKPTWIMPLRGEK